VSASTQESHGNEESTGQKIRRKGEGERRGRRDSTQVSTVTHIFIIVLLCHTSLLPFFLLLPITHCPGSNYLSFCSL